MPTTHQGFQNLLYFNLIYQKRARVEDIARSLGLSASTLYGYIEGKSTFPPDLIAPLYAATGDISYLTFILNDTDMRLIPRERADGKKSILEEVLDVAASHGDIVRKIQEALDNDGEIDERERRRIFRVITANFKELEDLRKCLMENAR